MKKSILMTLIILFLLIFTQVAIIFSLRISPKGRSLIDYSNILFYLSYGMLTFYTIIGGKFGKIFSSLNHNNLYFRVSDIMSNLSLLAMLIGGFFLNPWWGFLFAQVPIIVILFETGIYNYKPEKLDDNSILSWYFCQNVLFILGIITIIIQVIFWFLK